MWHCYLRAVGRKVLWSSACVCLSVRTFLSARYLKNGFMDHHQIWWVGAGGEPLEQVWFWCRSDSGCVSRITFPFPVILLPHWASHHVTHFSPCCRIALFAMSNIWAGLIHPARRFVSLWALFNLMSCSFACKYMNEWMNKNVYQ